MKVFHDSEGFTLAEVIVALVLLSAVSASLIRTLIWAHQMTPIQLDRVIASNLARDKAESLYEGSRQDWWNAADKPLSPGTVLGNNQNIVVDGKTYGRTYTAANVSLTGDDPIAGGQDYRKASVVVI